MRRPFLLLVVILGLFVILLVAHNMPRSYGPAGSWGPGMMAGYTTMRALPGGYGMGPAMMGGYGMGPGVGAGYGMSPGMMMGPGMMGGYGMGPWIMSPQWYGTQALELTTEDVMNYFRRWLAWQGNPRLTLGSVSEPDDDTITVDIVTTEGSVLVQRFTVNRHTGAMLPDQG